MSMRALLLEPAFNTPSQNHDRYPKSNSRAQLEHIGIRLLVAGKILMFITLPVKLQILLSWSMNCPGPKYLSSYLPVNSLDFIRNSFCCLFAV